ncbi:MAG TPA: stage II sporulation protein P [Sedimentibacter sp.]|nr:stage II sporulation protein P [Sedimentibacter sp.]
MKRRRKNKSGRSFYMVMSILCLTALFLGYSFVYNLSEERKTGKDITTISIKYNASGKEDDLSTFDRVMSYFNIFLEKTFKEKKSDDVDIIENIEPQSHKNEFFKTIASQEPERDLEIFKEDSYEPEADGEIYLADDKKESFFKVIQTTSRSSSSRRKLFLKTAPNVDGLNVVLFHTHGTEAFQSAYDSKYRSLDESLNILGIGTKISNSLLNQGINNIHLKGYNDYPDYNKSYANSNYAVRQVLSDSKKNVLIDLHRDGAEENSNYEAILSEVKTIEINGKNAATCTLVTGNKNKNAGALKENAGRLYDIAYEMYPGLFRKIIIREGAYFNQYLSDYSLLIEVGCTLNTYEEIEYTAELLTEVLYEYINEIQ